MTIDDINFGELYRSHVKGSLRVFKGVEFWDKKAAIIFSNATTELLDKESTYADAFLERMDLDDIETALDVGCGSGMMTVAVAPFITKVYALDFSPKMLEVTRDRAFNANILNCETILKSWNDDWSDIPECDICISSRSSMVADLEDALLKLNQKAKKMVYMTMVMDKDPINRVILNILGRNSIEFPSYIYAVNLLYQQGYQVSVDFIEMNPPQKLQKIHNAADFIQAAVWMVGALTQEEKQTLRQYYDINSHNVPTSYNTNRSWAFLKWHTYHEAPSQRKRMISLFQSIKKPLVKTKGSNINSTNYLLPSEGSLDITI